MVSIDSTIVILALLPIASDLRTDYLTMIWVIVIYLLLNTALVLSLGRMGDMYGRKRMYNTGFVIFTIGSGLSGLALNGIMLVLFRAFQGVGAALLAANSLAIVSEAFPPNERGKAFGFSSIVWGSGSVAGIVLGGIIISIASWRWIFLINIPIGIFATLWARSILKSDKITETKETFDAPAAVTFTLGLLLILIGITIGLLSSWANPLTIIFVSIAPIVFLFFALWELKFSKDPILPFQFFRNRVFSFSLLTAMLQSLALFSVNFLLIFYFEGIAGFDVLTASYLIVPMSVVSAIVGPFAGRISDRIGARIVATIALAIQAVVLILFSQITTETTPIQVSIIEAFYGLGNGMFFPANTSGVMSASPSRRYGVTSGILNTLRNTGMILSFVVALVATTSVLPAAIVYNLFIGDVSGGRLSPSLAAAYLGGQQFAFTIALVLIIIGAFFSLVRGKTSKHQPLPGADRIETKTTT